MLKSQVSLKLTLKRILRFWLWVYRQFVASDALLSAASLTVTSLLAMVPFLILMMTLVSLIPDYAHIGQKMQAFIFNNFAPQTGEVIGKYVNQLVERRIGLPIAVTIGLFIISIFMIRSIDRAVNSIWQIQHKRSLVNAFLLYWAIITLGPIFFGIGLGLSSYILSLKWVNDITLEGSAKLLLLLPSFFYFIAFVFLYRVIPCVKVKISHAILGALFSVVLFEIVKFGFALYVSLVPTYELIYGALVAVPLFILWVLIAWYIFLSGALVVKGLHLSQAQRSVYQMPPFYIALEVLKYLYNNMDQKHIASFAELLKQMPSVRVDDLEHILSLLAEKHLIYYENDHYVLCCNLDHLYFDELYQTLALHIPLDKSSQYLTKSADDALKALFHQPVVDILRLS